MGEENEKSQELHARCSQPRKRRAFFFAFVRTLQKPHMLFLRTLLTCSPHTLATHAYFHVGAVLPPGFLYSGACAAHTRERDVTCTTPPGRHKRRRGTSDF